jgi:hypothetical protein
MCLKYFVDVGVYVDLFYLRCVKILLLYSLYNLFLCNNFLLIHVSLILYAHYRTYVVRCFLLCPCNQYGSLVCFYPALIVKQGYVSAAIWCKLHALSQMWGCMCRYVYHWHVQFVLTIVCSELDLLHIQGQWLMDMAWNIRHTPKRLKKSLLHCHVVHQLTYGIALESHRRKDGYIMTRISHVLSVRT